MYALTYIEDCYEEDPGCTEDHEHSWCEQPSYGLSVTLGTLHLHRRDLGGHYEVSEDSYDTMYGVASVPIGSTAYVVVCEYIDGGTFGYSGYWCVAGVAATPEEADAIRKRCLDKNDLDVPVHRPWEGYFASLRDARVEPMTVLV
jgi:hypothetical protein